MWIVKCLVLFVVLEYLKQLQVQVMGMSGWSMSIVMVTRPRSHSALTLAGVNKSELETVIITTQTLASIAMEVVGAVISNCAKEKTIEKVLK